MKTTVRWKIVNQFVLFSEFANFHSTDSRISSGKFRIFHCDKYTFNTLHYIFKMRNLIEYLMLIRTTHASRLRLSFCGVCSMFWLAKKSSSFSNEKFISKNSNNCSIVSNTASYSTNSTNSCLSIGKNTTMPRHLY